MISLLQNMLKSFTLVTAMLVLAGASITQAEQVQAKILAVKGLVTVDVPGVGTQELGKGDLIPVGSKIKTSDNGNVILGLMPGASTIVQTNTDVTISELDIEKKNEKVESRTVKLDMPSDAGGVISFLNELDGVSDFRIQTPSGIAAARGTAWQVSGGNITVINGTVTVTTAGGQTISVPQGSMFNGQSGTVVQISDATLAALTQAIIDAGGDPNVLLTPLLGPSNPANTDELSPEQ